MMLRVTDKGISLVATIYEVWREEYGQMVLAETFETYSEAGEWAAEEYGLGRWEIRERQVQKILD